MYTSRLHSEGITHEAKFLAVLGVYNVATAAKCVTFVFPACPKPYAWQSPVDGGGGERFGRKFDQKLIEYMSTRGHKRKYHVRLLREELASMIFFVVPCEARVRWWVAAFTHGNLHSTLVAPKIYKDKL